MCNHPIYSRGLTSTSNSSHSRISHSNSEKKKIASRKFNSLLNFRLHNASRLKCDYNLLQNALCVLKLTTGPTFAGGAGAIGQMVNRY